MIKKIFKKLLLKLGYEVIRIEPQYDGMIECFEAIKKFNDVSGFLSKKVDGELEYTMLLEELNEYITAYRNNDEVEVRDALADLMVVLYGTILKHNLEFKFWNILKKICDSNNTKFCTTEQEAIDTVTKYKKDGIETIYVYNDTYSVYVIKNMSGKTLKSINFAPPKQLV